MAQGDSASYHSTDPGSNPLLGKSDVLIKDGLLLFFPPLPNPFLGPIIRQVFIFFDFCRDFTGAGAKTY